MEIYECPSISDTILGWTVICPFVSAVAVKGSTMAIFLPPDAT